MKEIKIYLKMVQVKHNGVAAQMVELKNEWKAIILRLVSVCPVIFPHSKPKILARYFCVIGQNLFSSQLNTIPNCRPSSHRGSRASAVLALDDGKGWAEGGNGRMVDQNG